MRDKLTIYSLKSRISDGSLHTEKLLRSIILRVFGKRFRHLKYKILGNPLIFRCANRKSLHVYLQSAWSLLIIWFDCGGIVKGIFLSTTIS